MTKKIFLVSVKSGQSNWGVMGIKGIEKLPAIQWELANIRKVGAKKCGELLEKLKRTLGLSGWRTREMPNLGDEPRQEG